MTIVIGAVLGFLAALILLPIMRPAIDFMGYPQVTVINATGSDISKVIITVGNAHSKIAELRDGQSITAEINGNFSESSTHLSWVDSTGIHEEAVEDYIENNGMYHSTIVLTPEGKAKLIYKIRESNLSFQGTRNSKVLARNGL
ncbi:MAG: hypothetical protein HY818_00005 [Acetobacterium woodii]|nr:hypothetical protein [Acetobacterium woodii]